MTVVPPESRCRDSRSLESTGTGLGPRAQGMTGVPPVGKYSLGRTVGPREHRNRVSTEWGWQGFPQRADRQRVDSGSSVSRGIGLVRNGDVKGSPGGQTCMGLQDWAG